MKLIAHRGYKTLYIKENTIEAFDNAINNGFYGIECDARNTKDKKIVICHDAFIDRTSNGSGWLKNYTYKELVKFNFGSKTVPSKIPLLKDVLNKYKTLILIELKEKISIKNLSINQNVTFISFIKEYLDDVLKQNENVNTGLLVLNPLDINNYKYNYICLLDKIITKKMANKLKSKIIIVYGLGKNSFKNINPDYLYISDNLNLIKTDPKKNH